MQHDLGVLHEKLGSASSLRLGGAIDNDNFSAGSPLQGQCSQACGKIRRPVMCADQNAENNIDLTLLFFSYIFIK